MMALVDTQLECRHTPVRLRAIVPPSFLAWIFGKREATMLYGKWYCDDCGEDLPSRLEERK